MNTKETTYVVILVWVRVKWNRGGSVNTKETTYVAYWCALYRVSV